MKPAHLILLVVLNLFWAASYSTFKVLTPYLNSGEVVTLRFSLAAILLVIVWPWLPGKVPRGFDLVKASVMGIIVFVQLRPVEMMGGMM